MWILVLLLVACIFFGALYKNKTKESQHEYIGCYGVVVLENGNEGFANIATNKDIYDGICYVSEEPLPYNTKIVVIGYNKITNTFLIGRKNETI
jgi:hypothetical protein